jgi:hypothetical protein
MDEAFDLARAAPLDPVAQEALLALLDRMTPERQREAVEMVLRNTPSFGFLAEDARAEIARAFRGSCQGSTPTNGSSCRRCW